MLIKPYVRYINEYGLPSVRARMWHPAIFIPLWKIRVRYWLNAYKRYKSYKKTIIEINKVLSENWALKDKVGETEALIQMVDCGYGCEWVKPFGFVVEADCPIHDI